MPPKETALTGTPIGENVTFAVENGIGVLRFALAHRGMRSKSGKTVRVFSTEGNRALPEMPAIICGLNGYTKE